MAVPWHAGLLRNPLVLDRRLQHGARAEEEEGFQSPVSRFIRTLSKGFKILALLAGFAFQVYAFYRLFHIYHVDNVMLWVNLVVTVVPLAAAGCYLRFLLYSPS